MSDAGEMPEIAVGRSGRPPNRIFYVAWGRSRLKESRLYRGPGWAKNRAKRAESDANVVRVYEARVTWTEVTERFSDATVVARAQERLAWAGTNPLRKMLLEEPRLADFLMRHKRWDQAVDATTGVWRRIAERSVPSEARVSRVVGQTPATGPEAEEAEPAVPASPDLAPPGVAP